jgi:hypothetical protein
MENRSLTPTAELDRLMSDAVSYAKREMQYNGGLETTLIISSPDGPLLITAGSMEGEVAKNEFAAVVRLFCTAHGATLAVLVTESWVVAAKEGQPLDLSVPPSQSPDRQECVVACGEARDGNAKQIILPIRREETGKFSGFGDALPLPPDPPQGRFARLLPLRAPRKGERQLARSLLKSMGVIWGGRSSLN